MWGDEQPSSNGASRDVTDGKSESDERHRAVLDCLGDEVSRSILAAAVPEPRAASDLAERCGVSRSTVYRRLNRLVDLGLVDEIARTDTSARAGSSAFQTTTEGLVVDIQEAGLSVRREPREPDAWAGTERPEPRLARVETDDGEMIELRMRVPLEHAARLLNGWMPDDETHEGV